MWRYYTIRVLTAALFVAYPLVVRAAGPPGGESVTPSRTVESASHVGRYAGGEMTWRSEYAVGVGHPGERTRLEFVQPLPESASVVETTPVDAKVVERDGRIVALRLPSAAAPRARVGLVVRQSFQKRRGLRPPFGGSTASQRVALQDVRFTPASETELVEFPGYIAPKGFGPGEQNRLEAAFEEPPAKTTQVVYARPVQLDEPWLRGEATPESQHKLRAVGILVGAMALLVLCGFGVYRWLESRAKEEEAEEVLREHGVSMDEVL